MKDKNHMIIPVHAEKQYLATFNTFSSDSKKKKKYIKYRTYLNTSKALHEKPTANIILNGGKTKFSL